MIESLPNNKFIVIGEPKVHNNLQDLLEYHQTVYIIIINYALIA